MLLFKNKERKYKYNILLQNLIFCLAKIRKRLYDVDVTKSYKSDCLLRKLYLESRHDGYHPALIFLQWKCIRQNSGFLFLSRSQIISHLPYISVIAQFAHGFLFNLTDPLP